MNISVFGLGYVGITTSACMAELGHQVYGVDINQDRVRALIQGTSPIKIGGIDDLLKKQIATKRLLPTTDYEDALRKSDMSFVCVQTPCKPDGDLDLIVVNRVITQIGSKLDKTGALYHTVVIRSTVFPGTLGKLEKILENRSGLKCHGDFGLAVNPEFLREVYAVEDFFNPPYVVVGSDSKEDAEEVMGLYKGIEAPKLIVKPDVAQMIKYVNNSWHACKVAFTNEVGEVCRRLGIDGDDVMALFAMDNKLNLSGYYHKIGHAYGGHCLPKDLSVFQYQAREVGAKVPLIDSISKSNDLQVKRDK